MDGITDNRHEFEQTLGDGEGQKSLVFCTPWGCKDGDMTERLNKKNITWQALGKCLRHFNKCFCKHLVSMIIPGWYKLQYHFTKSLHTVAAILTNMKMKDSERLEMSSICYQ